MKKTVGFAAVLFLSFVMATAGLAQPLTGSYLLESDAENPITWEEILLNGTEGQPGNELRASGAGFDLSGVLLVSVESTEENIYDTLYQGGILTLLNESGYPWYNAADPDASFVVNVGDVRVHTVKSYDGDGVTLTALSFTMEGEGIFPDFPDYRITMATAYNSENDGLPEFTPNINEIIMSGNLSAVTIDISAHVVALVDIKPGSDINPVNVKSQGVLPAALLGSDTFDVRDVDPASVRLEGIAPLRSSYEDVTMDGLEDLTLKFSTQAMLAVLGVENLEDGDWVELTLTGYLYDTDGNFSFEGSDGITILKKGKNGNENKGLAKGKDKDNPGQGNDGGNLSSMGGGKNKVKEDKEKPEKKK